MDDERVTLLTGPLKGTKYLLEGKLSIGRGPDNSIFLDDPEVSRQHAVIEQTPLGTMVRDLGSGNGTFIENRRILEFRLTDGDKISIGPFEILYEGNSPAAGLLASGLAAGSEDEFGRTIHSAAASTVYETLFAQPSQGINIAEFKMLQSRLRAVYEANQTISSERDLDTLFERVLEQVFKLVPAHNGVILLNEDRLGASDDAEVTGDNGEYALVRKCVKSDRPGDNIPVSSTIVRRAFEMGEAILTRDAAEDDRFGAGASIVDQNISSAMCAPLSHHDEVLGVLYVDTRGTRDAFDQPDLELLVALAGPAAIAIRNAQYLARLEVAYEDTLIVLANTIEARDHYTVGHTWRVTNFSVATAREMGWDEDRVEVCRKGGVLHDIGKIAVPDAVLNKPGPLTDEEFAMMKIHPEKGARIMEDLEPLAPMIPYALYHHERFDGKGYPFGIAGEEIPIEGRLVAVADTFDAITSNRPYRRGRPPEQALEIIKENSGSQFDPQCVDAFVRAYDKGNITRVMQEYYKDVGKSMVCPFCSTYIPVPEDASEGYATKCSVCHRSMKLMEKHGAFYAVLLSEKETRVSRD